MTSVIFRKWKSDNTIIALFPYEDSGNGFCGSYEHIGQHSQADYTSVIQRTKPCSELEYIELANELKSLGYDLRVLQRRGKVY